MQRIGRNEQILWSHVGDDCGRRGHEESGCAAVHGRDRNEMPDLQPPGGGEDRNRRRGDALCKVGQQHDLAPRGSVADRTSHREEQHLGEPAGRQDDGKCGSRFGKADRLPHERNREEAVAQQRHRLADPQEPEVPDRERAEDPQPLDVTAAHVRRLCVLEASVTALAPGEASRPFHRFSRRHHLKAAAELVGERGFER
jgi:hypothetical protein